ncbi:DgyrCDS4251 [Dimorphilus gyrociliatus]|uniref:Large ribosomal subunit protein mL46 n=1 Tax=Dimorphilus gyrociliatus TaxID=2664684 RepID=A0A7I8VHU7_9ANNE|nr:DgyrCDS4251 [Dimorphilus gyrociliatus]
MALYLIHRTARLKSIVSHAIQVQQNFSLSSKNHQNYDIFASVCLQRQRVLTSEKTPLEIEFSNFLQDLETKQSVYNDHELRHFEDLRVAEQRKLDIDADGDIIRETALDLEDSWDTEYQNFKPAPRTTEDDENKNLKSHNRELDSKLLLLTKSKLGDAERWVLPMGKWIKGESLRQTAERILAEQTGSSLNVQFLGNAPCGFYKYEYPSKEQTIGAKIFFFKADLKDGQITKNINFQWIKKQDIKPLLPPRYFKVVDRFVLDF